MESSVTKLIDCVGLSKPMMLSIACKECRCCPISHIHFIEFRMLDTCVWRLLPFIVYMNWWDSKSCTHHYPLPKVSNYVFDVAFCTISDLAICMHVGYWHYVFFEEVHKVCSYIASPYVLVPLEINTLNGVTTSQE